MARDCLSHPALSKAFSISPHIFTSTTRTTTSPPPPCALRPRIFCLHGHGTSANIFQIQLRRLESLLAPYFELVFVDAPFPSPPGPGVLPFFDGAGPFWRWSTGPPRPRPGVLEGEALLGRDGMGGRRREYDEERRIWNVVQSVLETEGGEWAGVIGFSQGARVAAGLLLLAQQYQQQQQRGRSALPRIDKALGSLHFGVFLSGTQPPICFPTGLSSLQTAVESGCGPPCLEPDDGDEAAPSIITIPTFHVLGLDDPWLSQNKLLLENVCRAGTATVLEFQGGHHVPVKTAELMRIRDWSLDLYPVLGV
jgi:hypothetical protein